MQKSKPLEKEAKLCSVTIVIFIALLSTAVFSVTFGYTLAFPKLILHHQLKIDYKRMSNQLRIGRSMLEILIYMKFATDKNAFKMGIIIYYNQILFM